MSSPCKWRLNPAGLDEVGVRFGVSLEVFFFTVSSRRQKASLH